MAGIEGADETVLEEVSAWLDVDSERLMLFQSARALESDTGLPAPMFYAMGRNGLGPSLDDFVDVPIHELRTTIEEAIAEGIVDADQFSDLDSLVDQLAQQILEHATRADRPPAEPGLTEVLSAADIPTETIKQVLRQYQSRAPEVTEFWDTWSETSEAEDLGDGTAGEVKVAIRLGEVLGPDPDLLRRMHELRREGRWQSPKDLSGLTFDDWCELLEDLQANQATFEESDPEWSESEEEAQERIQARAEAILDTLEEEFPSEFIRRQLAESSGLSEGARKVIERASNHDFLQDSIRAEVESNPQLLEGLSAEDADAALEDVEAVERVSRVTDRADEVAVLVESGIKSAMEIAATPRRHFVATYGQALEGTPRRHARMRRPNRRRPAPSSPRCACSSPCSTCRSSSVRRRRSRAFRTRARCSRLRAAFATASIADRSTVPLRTWSIFCASST
jgi:hypothetical protein